MTTVDDAPVKVPRKFPPPCWTQEEALALIEAYRERWYALRRGYLRTADWDSVADAVGQRCPGASPAKTSAQCRHKMEKLRQRYRAEKQRSLSYPGRFFSSWFYFESMDAMENGTSPGSGSNQVTVVDHNSVPLGFNLKNSKKVDNFTSSNVDHEGVLSRGGYNVKGVSERNSVPLGFRLKNLGKFDVKPDAGVGYRVPSGYPLYVDGGSDEEMENNGSQYEDSPSDFRVRKFGNGGIRIKNLSGEQLMPTAFRSRKVEKLDPDYECDDGGYQGGDGEYWGKVPNDRNSAPAGTRQKFNIKTDRNSNPNFDPRFMNEFPSQARSDLDRKSDSSRGVKRGRNPIEDMVSSIKLLGEGFMKMEKMKMDLAKEIEKMRMDMEMKRNELLIESQQQIVDAFVKGLFEKKAKTTLSPDS
ncbi:Trihelix transcription factor [Heracleum sosnowskyi]|uniref:Trihelix transcription factor n=1 Tax=Heracleum sosnowskyi TaxID=360622 RepID=A0AAD8GXG9_9APIA|nr:Trihelix transcription factor [Heracleum sosnowskyi]